MKKTIVTLIVYLYAQTIVSQTAFDSSIALVPQAANIITASTIVKIENLGININSDLPELRPTISADGNLLFFICQNHPANTKFRSVPNSQDIWYSKRDSLGNWCEARHMRSPLNSTHYNAVYWISPDNNRILIRGAFTEGAFLGKGVSMSRLQADSTWSAPDMLYIKNYEKYDNGRQSGATMAHDGQTLLLYMTPERGSPENDLYVCFLTANGSWTEPQSIGNKIS